MSSRPGAAAITKSTRAAATTKAVMCFTLPHSLAVVGLLRRSEVTAAAPPANFRLTWADETS
jgi:hypothetical protein